MGLFTGVVCLTYSQEIQKLEEQENDPDVGSVTLHRLVAGATAGALACSAAYPFDVISTRLAASHDKSIRGI